MVYNFFGTRQIVTGTFLSFLTVHFVKKPYQNPPFTMFNLLLQTNSGLRITVNIFFLYQILKHRTGMEPNEKLFLIIYANPDQSTQRGVRSGTGI